MEKIEYPFTSWQEMDFLESVPALATSEGDFREFLENGTLQLFCFLESLSTDEELINRIALQVLVILKNEWPKLRLQKNPKLRMYYVALRLMRRTQARGGKCEVVSMGARNAALNDFYEISIPEKNRWLSSFGDVTAKIRSLPRRQAEMAALTGLLNVSLEDAAKIQGVSALQAKEYYKSAKLKMARF